MRIDLKTFMAEYDRLWEKRYERKSIVTLLSTQRTRAMYIIKSWGIGEVIRRLGNYFNDREAWLERYSHPMAVFLKQVNNYGIGRRYGKAKIRTKEFDSEKENEEEDTRWSGDVCRR